MGESVVKNSKLGYFINTIDNPKVVEKKWRELEIRAAKSREELAAYKKAKRARARAAKAKATTNE